MSERLRISFSLSFNKEFDKVIDKNQVTSIVEQWLDDTDYFLVDVQVSPDNRIVVEIDHADGVWIDDCVDLSRHIEACLNRDEEDFELEVGSAGVGQPFKVHQQWINHIGKQVELLTVDGRKLRGTLTEVSNEGITLTQSIKKRIEGEKRPRIIEEETQFSFSELKQGKYCF